jgi:hypothetical protein
MYRIEVAPGEESVFRTIEELAVAIRNGVVTPRARIYHHASEKWLPIGLHPHYKKALEMPVSKTAHPSGKTPTPAPTARPSPPPAPRATAIIEPPAQAKPPRPIPPPVQSPIVAMQQEVLRDLPVVAIPEPVATVARPEPLPWSPPAPRVAAAPPPRPIVPPRPTVSAAPTFAEPAPERPAAPAMEPRHAASAIERRHQPPAMETQQEEIALEPHHAALEDAGPARPTARRSRRMSGRPTLLVGVAAALVIGTHLALTATPSPDRAESTVPREAAEPGEPQAVEQQLGAQHPVQQPPVPRQPPVSRQPALQQRAQPPRATREPERSPMVPGPAFTGSAPVRPGSHTANPPSRTTTTATLPPPASVDPAAPDIAPPPAALDLALPSLPDSTVPSARVGDTLAMKKILQALNGAKP